MTEMERFAFSKREFARLQALWTVRRTLWFSVPMAVIGLVLLAMGGEAPRVLLGVLAIVYVPLFALGWSLWSVRGRTGMLVQRHRTLRFDREALELELEGGSQSRIRWGDFISARRFQGYLLLFVARSAYVPVPLSAFRSDEDRSEFEAILRETGLMR